MKVPHNISVAFFLCAALISPEVRAGFLDVPQTSAADYIFTTPILTNNIQGKVIDPSSPYGVIRSEDLDWFHEAFIERESLVLGSILSLGTDGVGAQIVRPDFGVLWNGPVRRREDLWLDPDVQLLSGSRLVDRNKIGHESVTNVFSETFMTNGVTNAISVISMAMTNGTTSVFTNKWSAHKLFNSGLTREITNVVIKSLIDYCCQDVEIFTGYTNTPKMSFGMVVTSNGVDRLIFTDFPNAGVFSNACEVLRGTNRLGDDNANVSNSVMAVFESIYDNDPDSYVRRDMVTSAGAYRIYTENDYANRTYTPTFTAIIPTRFHGHIATTGGVNRVSVAGVFALCNFTYTHDENYQETQNVSTGVVLRISNPTLDTSGATAVVRFSLDAQALCSLAAEAAGCPSAPASIYAYREVANGDESEWSITFDQYAIIYSITPGTVLPNW